MYQCFDATDVSEGGFSPQAISNIANAFVRSGVTDEPSLFQVVQSVTCNDVHVL